MAALRSAEYVGRYAGHAALTLRAKRPRKKIAVSYVSPGVPGPSSQRHTSKGAIGKLLATLAAIATILTFIFTYVIHSPSTHSGEPGGQGGSHSSDQRAAQHEGSYSYPVNLQNEWLSDCENNNFSVSSCQCKLSFFESHATYQQFEQDYSAMPPGVVPSQLSGASAGCDV
jgi:hypothetical protein